MMREPQDDLGRKKKGGFKPTHGYSRTRLYRTWTGMRGRCHRETSSDFPLYGGRGIRVYEEWRKDFQPFKEWALKSGYEDGLQIDRIDTNGDYSPENCRWVTNKENSNNRRTNLLITIDGETKNLTQWSEEYGIKKETLWRRYTRYGLSGRELLRPVRGISK